MVIQVGAVMMIFFGIFTKFGAVFLTLPDPIIGGVFIVMFGGFCTYLNPSHMYAGSSSLDFILL